MRRLAFLATLLLLLGADVEARVYKWNAPDSGRTHFSGKPPAWYRSGQDGPRVFVFDGNELVDDTAREVPEARRRALRAEALRLAMPAEAAEQGAAELHAALGEGREAGGVEGSSARTPLPGYDEDLASLLAPPPAGERTEEAPVAAEDPEATIARLKAILEAWDQRQTERAKALVD